jgi:hypothetical protein
MGPERDTEMDTKHQFNGIRGSGESAAQEHEMIFLILRPMGKEKRLEPMSINRDLKFERRGSLL